MDISVVQGSCPLPVPRAILHYKRFGEMFSTKLFNQAESRLQSLLQPMGVVSGKCFPTNELKAYISNYEGSVAD